MKNKIIACLLFALFAGFFTAYAKVDKPKPMFCTPSISQGETKDSIKARWGEPDQVIQLAPDEIGLPREEWLYKSAPFGVLSGHSYVCKTQRLIFEGDHVVDIKLEEEPLPYEKE
ncbi:MAG: hypothetical protein PHO42_04120 [Candidatus Omnitrophica bacterium]|nr:hypothetical protein [Candidatus Omnitrophota bacterium]